MSSNIQILHVDDDQALLDLTAEMIHHSVDSITVWSESDPTNVPERLEDEQIDCVVSDQQMPECTGLELCERVRTEHPRLPFFLFTSVAGQEIVDDALEAGVTDYVRKETGTHHYRLLANRVENAVERHRAVRRLGEYRGQGEFSWSSSEPVGDQPATIDSD